MDQKTLTKYANDVSGALNQGIPAQEAEKMLKYEGISKEDIQKIMGMATANADVNADAPTAWESISLEQAVEYIDGLGAPPELVLAVVQLLMNMKPEDIEALMQLIAQHLQDAQGQAQQQGQGPPPEEQGAGVPPQGQQRYEI